LDLMLVRCAAGLMGYGHLSARTLLYRSLAGSNSLDRQAH